jgi:hypothetical protein
MQKLTHIHGYTVLSMKVRNYSRRKEGKKEGREVIHEKALPVTWRAAVRKHHVVEQETRNKKQETRNMRVGKMKR